MISFDLPTPKINIVLVDETAAVAGKAANLQIWIGGSLFQLFEAVIVEEKGSDGGYHKVVNFRKAEK